MVRRCKVTDAAVHDSQVVEDILDPNNTASDVWTDSAFRSAEIKETLAEKGLRSQIHGLVPLAGRVKSLVLSLLNILTKFTKYVVIL